MQPRDRAGDKIRGEAIRLGFTGAFADTARIEAQLIETGFSGVPEALRGMQSMLDNLCKAAKRPRSEGIESMFWDS